MISQSAKTSSESVGISDTGKRLWRKGREGRKERVERVVGKDCGSGGDEKKGRKGEGGEERENERGNLHITHYSTQTNISHIMDSLIFYSFVCIHNNTHRNVRVVKNGEGLASFIV